MADEQKRVSGLAKGRTVSRSTVSGRFVSKNERVAAARARVVADRKRGVTTAPWIVELAKR
ncbi:hypothetical protein GC088_09945 [Arthrobacter sp. JZ12]|uniref:hypothetical protein n=1 Tax=Arthrobacter sp. JZ12 TaxID=2654190 RepID=UPI002B46AFF6|nr:hypothetical protein [Arthrobacter sp. JZ12]WRH25351.1 hypothetical protein GC088_09945 [Arthrobacter sp. JZ12]